MGEECEWVEVVGKSDGMGGGDGANQISKRTNSC